MVNHGGCVGCKYESQCVLGTAEAQEMAISALKEIQQYRDIGTVEEIEERNFLKTADETTLMAYEAIGTVEECREAREKQISIKPRAVLLPYGKGYECRNCGNELSVNSFNGEYCHWCGRKLDWSEEK